jgi:flagellar assembly protein FliH
LSTENGSPAPIVRLDGVPAGVRIVAGGADALVARHVADQVERARREGQRAACDTAAKALTAASERLDLAREEAAAALASQAVELALEIARALIRAEVSAGRHGLEAMVRDALAASGAGRGACVLHVHPHDAAMLAGVRFRAGTVIEPDETVARGDVHVSTANGLLVREIPEALAAIEARLGELL